MSHVKHLTFFSQKIHGEKWGHPLLSSSVLLKSSREVLHLNHLAIFIAQFENNKTKRYQTPNDNVYDWENILMVYSYPVIFKLS